MSLNCTREVNIIQASDIFVINSVSSNMLTHEFDLVLIIVKTYVVLDAVIYFYAV